VGGSARTWRTTLKDDIDPGSEIELRLVMTKFGAPAVDIAYEIRVEIG